MSPVLILVTALVVGIAVRTILPFLITLRDNPDVTWNRRFFLPPLISLVIAIILSPLAIASLPPDALNMPVTVAGLALLFTSGYGSTDVVRDVQKLIQRPSPPAA